MHACYINFIEQIFIYHEELFGLKRDVIRFKIKLNNFF